MCGAGLSRSDCGVETDVGPDREMVRIILEVLLENRPRREIGYVLFQRPIGKFKELFLKLNAEVEVTIGPDAADGRLALENCTVEALR